MLQAIGKQEVKHHIQESKNYGKLNGNIFFQTNQMIGGEVKEQEE